jgi:hypothetical protein
MQSEINAKTRSRKDAKEEGEIASQTNARLSVTRIDKANSSSLRLGVFAPLR